MPNHFKSLIDVLGKDNAFSNFRKSVKEQDVLSKFCDIFPDLRKTVKPSNMNKGILYLVVENSVLRNELYLKKSIVIKKINDHFNQQIVVDIKFTNFRNIPRKIT